MTKNIDFDTVPTHCVGTMSRFLKISKNLATIIVLDTKQTKILSGLDSLLESMDKRYSSASSDRQNLSWITRNT